MIHKAQIVKELSPDLKSIESL